MTTILHRLLLLAGLILLVLALAAIGVLAQAAPPSRASLPEGAWRW